MIVAESDLVLTFPRTLALRWASFLPLEIVELPFELAPFTLHAVWHERVQDDPGHAWLREQLVASLEDGSSHG
jgi:DNA-binding transcriptional LysR family regulator